MRKKPISEYPHMMAQWHPTKNSQFDVNTTAAGLRKKAWWLCPKCGYEWEALISTRKESKGYCPKCDKDKQGPATKTTISMIPNLMDYWDFGANPDKDPYTLTATKRAKANWKCPECGYKWNSSINNRYYYKTGCPACSGAVATETNNVLVWYPEIANYYDYDYPNNPPLASLRKTSRTVVHWKCPDCGHKWAQPPASRVKYGRVLGCAICTGARIKGSYADVYPEVAKMYSSSNEVPFNKLCAKDRDTYFLWECPDCFYEFESTLGYMLRLVPEHRNGCPFCLGKWIVSSEKSIARFRPELLDEVDDGTDLYLYPPNSKKCVDWKCKNCGYTWTTTIVLRGMGHGNCPVCNNTHPVKGYNTVADLFMEFAKQWAPSNTIKPDEVKPSSAEWGKRLCPDCGGEHSVQRCRATSGDIVCPYCNEQKVAPRINSLDVTNPELVPMWSKDNTRDISTVANFMSYKAYWDCLDCGGTYSAEINKVVSGEAYCKYCADEALLPGFNSLDKTNPELAPEWSPRNASPMSHVKANSWYRAYWICQECGGEHLATIKAHMDGTDSCKYCEGLLPIPGVNSLKVVHPQWMKEYDPSNAIDPDTVFETYTLPLLWICEEGHHYSRSPLLRIQDEAEGRESCPYCDERTPTPGVNTLKALRPRWVDELAPENTVDPDTIFETYSFPLIWICEEGHHYSRSPLLRIQDEAEGRESCPYCNERKVLPGFNSFAVKHPDLLKEWDFVNNYAIVDPDTVSEGSNVKVWFKCLKDSSHSNYEMTIATRVLFKIRKRNPCPICNGRRRKKRHFL